MTEKLYVATLGTEPQVVTLALDKLLEAGNDFSQAIVVHTSSDREPIRSSLQALYDEFQVKRYYGTRLLYVPYLLAGPQGPLDDVKTLEEIDIAFQSFYTLIRQHKHAGRTIHLCIAGGRKTIALFAMSAAQILFDTNDVVWHVVSSPELVRTKKLHATNLEDVSLVPVPIARWKRADPDSQSRARDFIENVLTPAEREVTVLLIREGLSNAALAKRLNKSVKTVANQLSSVYIKLGEYHGLESTPDRALLLVLLGSYS